MGSNLKRDNANEKKIFEVEKWGWKEKLSFFLSRKTQSDKKFLQKINSLTACRSKSRRCREDSVLVGFVLHCTDLDQTCAILDTRTKPPSNRSRMAM